ncbi:DEAD/DEAH box helicase [Helicobacter anatolicus]|uniref:DEAD/DEAH box helicase n=1 Tax=Helicobacter anatolicus TaxID=2905874 RepID=UPI001E2D3728|nr:DEAD/DEAH box helicase [Helicobacter anatolicus]MCE3039579.1 DEAD/DEAH box helicase [Helicobacter anatolicus]
MKDNKITFESLGLSKALLRGIKEAGFQSPSPIQEQAIPAVLKGRDIIAQAQTGTGKTAAFALPIIELLSGNISEALIITPTRELAMQISDEFSKLGKYKNIKTLSIVGGQSMQKQLEIFRKNPQIIVATPGRLLDYLQNGRLEDFTPRFVVLDESDEMLDMGFLPDIEQIFQYLPNNIQTLLFSATMPDAINKLAQKNLHNPVQIKITPANITNLNIMQHFCLVNDDQKYDALSRLLENKELYKGIIFTRTKKEADNLHTALSRKGYSTGVLHGDMHQFQRRETITNFKNKRFKVLVATDVASRGLDISDISHVFNYHLPHSSEVYVHRIGRTGRAGKKGIAFTIATPSEFSTLKQIQKDVGSDLKFYEIPQEQGEVKKTIQKLKEIKINPKAQESLEALLNHFNLSEIALKLLSIQMQNKNIGLSKNDFFALEKEFHKEKNTKKSQKNSTINSRHKNTGHKNQRGSNKVRHNAKKGHY